MSIVTIFIMIEFSEVLIKFAYLVVKLLLNLKGVKGCRTSTFIKTENFNGLLVVFPYTTSNKYH